VRSTGRVLAWPAPSPRSGWAICFGRTIAFRIVDPASKRSGCPAGSSAAQVNWRWKPVSRYAAVEGRPTQRGYSENIMQSIEGRRDLHALGDPCAFSRDPWLSVPLNTDLAHAGLCRANRLRPTEANRSVGLGNAASAGNGQQARGQPLSSDGDESAEQRRVRSGSHSRTETAH
jgi:hypothetical protein